MMIQSIIAIPVPETMSVSKECRMCYFWIDRALSCKLRIEKANYYQMSTRIIFICFWVIFLIGIFCNCTGNSSTNERIFIPKYPNPEANSMFGFNGILYSIDTLMDALNDTIIMNNGFIETMKNGLVLNKFKYDSNGYLLQSIEISDLCSTNTYKYRFTEDSIYVSIQRELAYRWSLEDTFKTQSNFGVYLISDSALHSFINLYEKYKVEFEYDSFSRLTKLKYLDWNDYLYRVKHYYYVNSGSQLVKSFDVHDGDTIEARFYKKGVLTTLVREGWRTELFTKPILLKGSYENDCNVERRK